ncbi:hypothetical protein OV079_02605 [Nannocystis pusilla]|uniref:Uncharacterized protein n=1 Tax=Nannocystis pusilla TaxID=889268 RepID=A0A9X3EI55_9BACT|nr:hypothetical protein [Nannocystis pusilla]MCY1004477.1 hypothetical protein [Nannocystis pusilla]
MNQRIDIPESSGGAACPDQRAREFAERCDGEALDRMVAFAPDTPLGRVYREACLLERDARRIAEVCSDAELDRILSLPDKPGGPKRLQERMPR